MWLGLVILNRDGSTPLSQIAITTGRAGASARSAKVRAVQVSAMGFSWRAM